MKGWGKQATFLDEPEELNNIISNNKPESIVILKSHLYKRPDESFIQMLENIKSTLTNVGCEDITGSNSSSIYVRGVNTKEEDEEVINKQAKFRKCELIESLLASVTIIDERIYNNCDQDEYKFNWQRRDIRVYDYDSENAKFISKLNNTGKPDIQGSLIDYNFIKRGDGHEKKVDFLVLHRGIIEKMIGTENDNKVFELFDKLNQVARFVVVDSGRGKPEYIKESKVVRFTNLENLYQWFFDCKVSLVRGLFSLINREGA